MAPQFTKNYIFNNNGERILKLPGRSHKGITALFPLVVIADDGIDVQTALF
jgi:hypothetical protein